MSVNNKNTTSLLSDIKNHIQNLSDKTETLEVGNVISLGDGIALVDGLESVMLNEIVRFESGVEGIALNLEEDAVGVVLMGDYDDIQENERVYRTHRIVQVPVGDVMLGRVVNALGKAVDGKQEIVSTKFGVVEKIAPGVMERKSVHQPLETGILSIDAMFPIGKGQRELIIGDRQTGKTTIAIDAIINQKGKNVNCVYVAVGQKNSTVANIVRTLEENNAMEFTTVVAANASELPALQYLAPFAGMTIAEEWMHEGKDVLIVFDDLSKHAIAYRTLSLLLRRPPGREAYPGDVFYLHSRLLERACKLSDELGAGSITALPIIETQAGDISAYIPTNVISITDGQIFMQTNLFNAGQRPAIDAGQSVSRVGSAAQIKSVKQTGAALKLELANYRELEAFSQFGSDLDEETKNILRLGKSVMAVIKQEPNKPYSQTDEAIILFTVKEKMIPTIPVEKIADFKLYLIDYFKKSPLRRDLDRNKAFSKENTPAFKYEIWRAMSLFLHNDESLIPEDAQMKEARDAYFANIDSQIKQWEQEDALKAAETPKVSKPVAPVQAPVESSTQSVEKTTKAANESCESVVDEPTEEQVCVKPVCKASQEAIKAREEQVLVRSDDAVADKEKQTIMVSVSPEEAEALFENEKPVLFFKVTPVQPVERVIVYATAPVKKVVGEFDLEEIKILNPRTAWRTYGANSVIKTAKEFNAYFANNSEAHVIIASAIYKYSNPKTLDKYDIKKGPSGFTYLK
ncbi:F0F1 ATP synthase subunit alpha [Ureaplasma miroungigenitalium]|uniref:F0F1 ATP synthase subunit alpha n=1 Tax=Ureaplasma miroungigenitalium TaxID=1042321 RepID=UPI0021E89A84|nr:F0F1 ATP synthase subunit alpha [Ureaplasma miroungigenitalium]MCV3734313.1 F0F1 ATP synthase subunit alpha [Ureaplasma miroungigenitalium]